jgi:hypothetical protein
MTDFSGRAQQALAGTFMARATYGAEYIAPAFWVGGDNDAEKNDDYRGYLASQGFSLLDQSGLPAFDDRGGDSRFTSGGLFDSRADTLVTNSFDAQGLLAVRGDTLYLAFRGTDGEDPAVVSGQAFTGDGVAANYKAFRPLIDAAYDYLVAHPDLTDVVVSGHSLGGAMADVFALCDAGRFRDLRPDHLTIVSLGSSGVPPDLPAFLSGIDGGTVVYKKVLGVETPVIKKLILPGDYISIANSADRAHFPNDFPDVPEALGLVPVVALKNNLQFGGDTLFRVPNIANSDVKYYDPLSHPADFRGMGAQHSSALLWANVEGLVNDDLFSYYNGQRLTAGITDYNAVPDFNGDPVSLFLGYVRKDNPNIVNDSGARALAGASGQDYILGLAGNDRIDGLAGRDILSGGHGDDVIFGGDGNDVLSGGPGRDLLSGGAGRDRFVFTTAEQSHGATADVIRAFNAADDRIDLRAVAGGLQFIGADAFSDLGQIRAIQSGADTLLRVDVIPDAGAEMMIVLKNFDSALLTDANFIL